MTPLTYWGDSAEHLGLHTDAEYVGTTALLFDDGHHVRLTRRPLSSLVRVPWKSSVGGFVVDTIKKAIRA